MKDLVQPNDNNKQTDGNLMQRTVIVDRKDECNNTGDTTSPFFCNVVRHAEQQFPELRGYGASDTSVNGRTPI